MIYIYMPAISFSLPQQELGNDLWVSRGPWAPCSLPDSLGGQVLGHPRVITLPLQAQGVQVGWPLGGCVLGPLPQPWLEWVAISFSRVSSQPRD